MSDRPAGNRPHRMAIYKVSANETADGGTDEDPSFFCNIWCSIRPISGQELWLMKAQQDKISHYIRCLYLPGITPQMYGVFKGRRFNFTSVTDPDERRIELKIEAIEVVEPTP